MSHFSPKLLCGCPYINASNLDIVYIHQYTCIIADILANYWRVPLQRLILSTVNSQPFGMNCPRPNTSSYAWLSLKFLVPGNSGNLDFR